MVVSSWWCIIEMNRRKETEKTRIDQIIICEICASWNESECEVLTEKRQNDFSLTGSRGLKSEICDQ